MIFGDKNKFAIECSETKTTDGIKLIQARFLCKCSEIGDFSEMAVAGAVLLAINCFLKFSGLRNLPVEHEEQAFDYLYSSMYGDDWRRGIAENFRDKFSIHDLFELSIADQGHVIFLVVLPGGTKMLFGNRDGKYFDFIDVSEELVNSLFTTIAAWMTNG